MFEVNSLIGKTVDYISDVPVLTRNQIDAAAQRILEQKADGKGESQTPTDVDYLIEQVFGLTLDFQTLQPDGAILGETIFTDGYREVYNNEDFVPDIIQVKPGTIILDSSMCDMMTTRSLFTEAHELGHWLLHKTFYSATNNRACRSLLFQRLYFPHFQAKTPVEWTEWQANTFAAALLLPRTALRKTLSEFLKENQMVWKELSNYSEYRNRVKYVELLHRISEIYCVSTETARLRMNKLCGIRFPN